MLIRLIPIVLCLGVPLWGQDPAPDATPPSDLDAFMQKVLERREANWATLQDFIFREKEELELRGFDIAAEESFRKEYDWYYRGGDLVRRLVRSDGVKVDGPEKRWDPEQRKKKEPLARENFFGFKFEPGNYLLAGSEKLEGREVLVVEYYPKHLFDDDEDGDHAGRDAAQGKEEEAERDFEQAFQKTSLVKLWILPEEHQIVKMTFENVGLEFLPYRWLVRIDDINATLIMDKPVGDVWLPREMTASGKVSTAAASLTVMYERKFFDYKEADVKVRFQFEGAAPEKQPEKPPRP
ncbi:MAG: hypothetical protein WAO20_10515 [Acidobacteriota bacterium]